MGEIPRTPRSEQGSRPTHGLPKRKPTSPGQSGLGESFPSDTFRHPREAVIKGLHGQAAELDKQLDEAPSDARREELMSQGHKIKRTLFGIENSK